MCTSPQSSCTDCMNISTTITAKNAKCVLLNKPHSCISLAGGSFLNVIQFSRLVYCYVKLCCISTNQTISCNFWQLKKEQDSQLFPNNSTWAGSRSAAWGKNEAFRFDEIRLDETIMISFEKYGYWSSKK